MGYKDIKAGIKTAKPFAARFIKTPKGTLGMEVAFKFKEGENEETMNWQAWLSDMAMPHSMKTLVEVLGFNGNDSIDANSVLTDPNALAYGREVSLDVQIETYTDKDGNQKESPKIKWVNKLGGSAFSGCTVETIKNELGAIGFRAAFLSAKQGNAQMATIQKPAELTQAGLKSFNQDDMPF